MDIQNPLLVIRGGGAGSSGTMKTATLNNNATTFVDLVDFANFKKAIVTYTNTRGVNVDSGDISIFKDGAIINDDGGFISPNETGLTITSNLNNGKVRLSCVLDNSGGNATLSYSVRIYK
jgi:hypothetical protein